MVDADNTDPIQLRGKQEDYSVRVSVRDEPQRADDKSQTEPTTQEDTSSTKVVTYHFTRKVKDPETGDTTYEDYNVSSGSTIQFVESDETVVANNDLVTQLLITDRGRIRTSDGYKTEIDLNDYPNLAEIDLPHALDRYPQVAISNGDLVITTNKLTPITFENFEDHPNANEMLFTGSDRPGELDLDTYLERYDVTREQFEVMLEERHKIKVDIDQSSKLVAHYELLIGFAESNVPVMEAAVDGVTCSNVGGTEILAPKGYQVVSFNNMYGDGLTLKVPADLALDPAELGGWEVYQDAQKNLHLVSADGQNKTTILNPGEKDVTIVSADGTSITFEALASQATQIEDIQELNLQPSTQATYERDFQELEDDSRLVLPPGVEFDDFDIANDNSVTFESRKASVTLTNVTPDMMGDGGDELAFNIENADGETKNLQALYKEKVAEYQQQMDKLDLPKEISEITPLTSFEEAVKFSVTNKEQALLDEVLKPYWEEVEKHHGRTAPASEAHIETLADYKTMKDAATQVLREGDYKTAAELDAALAASEAFQAAQQSVITAQERDMLKELMAPIAQESKEAFNAYHEAVYEGEQDPSKVAERNEDLRNINNEQAVIEQLAKRVLREADYTDKNDFLEKVEAAKEAYNATSAANLIIEGLTDVKLPSVTPIDRDLDDSPQR